jgi:predicted transposase/invertase (TIGR01784 family)
MNPHTEKYTDPTYDWAFKRVFLSEGNEDMLKIFINDVLQGELVVENIINVTIPPKENIDDKTSFFDIFCEDKSGQKFIVEMQRKGETDFLKRLGYYWGRAYTRQLKTNHPYRTLQHVTLVVICDFPILKNLMGDPKRYVERFALYGQESQKKLMGMPPFFSVLDLPAYRKMGFPHQSDLDEWLDFFTCTDRTESEPKVQVHRPSLIKALDLLAYDKLSSEEKDLLEADADRQRRMESTLDYAKEEGVKQGIEKGRQEEQRDMVKKMIAAGVPIETVMAVTGLSEDEIPRIS